MKKGMAVLGLFLLISIGIHTIQYRTNIELQKDVDMYKENKEYLLNKVESLEMILSAEVNDKQDLEVCNIKEIPNIQLMVRTSSAEDVFQSDYFSATGPLAELNGLAINANGGVILVEAYDPYISKVYIEGYIPTWYLSNEEYPISIQKEDEQEAYIVVETEAYYGAEENSGFVTHFDLGNGIQILGSLGDWYYIKSLDENKYAYPNMWVKKEVVGNFETLQSVLSADSMVGIHAKIPIGASVMDGNWPLEEADAVIMEENRIGEIKKEDEKYYYIGFPGTVLWAIEKSEVVFLGE